MKVLVLAEYYPRAENPVLGIWAHRQALAARQAGTELRVLVLHRPLPPLRALRSFDGSAIRGALAQPRTVELDGLRVDYLRYVSPPRPWTYGSWGAWAAPVVKRALRRIRAEFRFDLVHAHYAVPAGDAVRRAAPSTPLVVSVHGGDVHGSHAHGHAVGFTLAHAQLVLANSSGTARRCTALGGRAVRVVHLGTDLPSHTTTRPARATLVTVGNLIGRKGHADVIAALATLRVRHPEIRYVIAGDGPERESLRKLAQRLGVADRVELRGRLGHHEAVDLARSGSLFVLPSVAEAFGVSYVEAMAGGVPAVGCRGEDGPEEIAAVGGGIELVAPRDPAGLAVRLDALLSDPERLDRMGREARLTVQRSFTWELCGRETVSAYHDALRGSG
jgi:teichuronic acid biosynthesis glycosyltransferase TuaC